MRWPIAIVVVTGCAFDPPGVGAPDNPVDPSGDGGAPVVPTCSVPGTVLCLEFEQDADPMVEALDGSGTSNHADATSVTVVSGSVFAQAPDAHSAIVDTRSELRVPAAANLNLTTAFTLEMWVVRTLAVPNGMRYWLVDSSGQFGMSVRDDDQLHCGINADARGIGSDRDIPINDGTWHHVACTYDADGEGELRVYIDGAVEDCERRAGAIAEVPGDTTIGVRTGGGLADHFVGSLDNVHVYPTALSATQICTLAGRTDCDSSCPSRGPQQGGGQGP